MCYVSYNVHNLLHLTDDVERFGVIDNFSAFPFAEINSTKPSVEKLSREISEIKIVLIEVMAILRQNVATNEAKSTPKPNLLPTFPIDLGDYE